MCTALTIKTKENHYFFGRNMDLSYSFNQSPIYIPKNYQYLERVSNKLISVKKVILGMGTVIDNYPAMAEAMNESGLACAGLNFEGYAYVEPVPVMNKQNIAPYEFILWVLSNHDTVDEVITNLPNIELVDVPIMPHISIPTLHWMITDKSGKSIVVEKTKEKFTFYNNPVGVLTNNPTFEWHLTNLNEYINLNANYPTSIMWNAKELTPLGIGAGTIGMPGDFASVSRFVRIAYLRAHLPENIEEGQVVSQFFHMLDYVGMVKGGVLTKSQDYDLTLYSSCMDLERGIYYYKNYENNRINVINMHKESTDNDELHVFSYEKNQDFKYQN